MLNVTTMNVSDFAIAYSIARTRTHVNRAVGVHDTSRAGPHNLTPDELGAIGEVGIAKLLNVYPDTEIGARKYSYDLLYRNNRIDVKATQNVGGALWIQRHNPDVDVYVLAVYDSERSTVECFGYMFSCDAFVQSYKQTSGAYRVGRERLHASLSTIPFGNFLT